MDYKEITGFLPEWDNPEIYQQVQKEKAMSEYNHTPGPWFVEEYLPEAAMHSVYSEHECAEDDSKTICSHKFWGEGFRAESKANMLLIAAAPDLLEAAIKAMRCVPSIGGFQLWPGEAVAAFNALHAAIDKASSLDTTVIKGGNEQ